MRLRSASSELGSGDDSIIRFVCLHVLLVVPLALVAQAVRDGAGATGVQLSSGLIRVLLMGLGVGGTDRPSLCQWCLWFRWYWCLWLGGMWEVQVCTCCTLYMTPHVTNIAKFKA